MLQSNLRVGCRLVSPNQWVDTPYHIHNVENRSMLVVGDSMQGAQLATQSIQGMSPGIRGPGGRSGPDIRGEAATSSASRVVSR